MNEATLIEPPLRAPKSARGRTLLTPAEHIVDVISDSGEGADAAYGSTSRWLAFIQQRAGAFTTLLLFQPGDVRPWFLRSEDYVGAGPALAWDGPLDLQPEQTVSFSLSALLLDHPLADTIARAGHDLVHDRFCVQKMVNAIQELYDEGARAVRPREVWTAAG